MLLLANLSVPKRIVCAMLWIASSHVAAETKPNVTVDLLARGLRADFFEEMSYAKCPHEYLGYRSVQWLDAERVLVAFNTSPDCAKTEGIVAGVLRLATFDLKGNLLHSIDVPFDAGGGLAIPALEHDGVWLGPSQTVIVEIPGSQLKAQPNSRNRVVVLSSELSLEQEIDTDWHENYYDRINFGRTTPDHQAVLFWTSDGVIGHERNCLIYKGTPLKQTGTCAPQDLDKPDPPPEYRQSALLPGYEVRAFAGSSVDGARVSLFGVKHSTLCDDFGKFCPSQGRLIAFDTVTKRLILRVRFPLTGRAALSPTGRHLAAFENNRLEIFALP